MTPDQFRELLLHDPFIPLRLHLMSGEIVDVANPDSVLIQGATLQIFTIKRHRAPIVDTNRYIPLRAIAQVEQSATA